VPLCDFNNRALTCPACGYRARRLPTYRECRPVVRPEWRPIPIGDVVERGLTRIGLSKERVQRWTRRAGVEDCGCQSRQRWLNEVGNDVQRKARAALLKARRFYVGS